MASVKEQIKAFFDEHDTNKNGRLELDELPALLKELGLEAVEAERMMAAADKNKDGTVSFEELCNLMSI